MNPPTRSKINIAASATSLLNALILLAVTFDQITAEQAVPIGTIANIGLNGLIVMFRSKFTGTSTPEPGYLKGQAK